MSDETERDEKSAERKGSDDKADAQPAPKKGLDRFTLIFYVGLALAAVVTFVAWRRARNPLRMWAAQAEVSHAREIDTTMQRCLGTTSAAGVRQLAAAVRRGPVPSPFKDCHNGAMAEMLVAPNAFVSSIQNTPLELYRVRERERVALQRLTGSFRLLEPAVARAGENPTAAQREVLGSKLEELAPDVEQERRAFEDLVTIARDQAGMF